MLRLILFIRQNIIELVSLFLGNQQTHFLNHTHVRLFIPSHPFHGCYAYYTHSNHTTPLNHHHNITLSPFRITEQSIAKVNIEEIYQEVLVGTLINTESQELILIVRGLIGNQ